MALRFRKIKRKVLNGPEKDQEKFYAMARTSGVSSLDKMCELICSRSSLSAADVKGVFDSLNWAMRLELMSGAIVQLGELGSFRLSVRSEGAATEKELDAHHIKRANIIFTPGKILREMQFKVSFVPEIPVEKTCETCNEEPEGGL